MHELSLMQAVLEIAQESARREGARVIKAIGLRVGALSGVQKEALEFAFEAARADTLAAGARLEVEWVPLVAFCQGCGAEFEVDNPFGIALCPLCGEPVAALTSGEELQVTYLDVV